MDESCEMIIEEVLEDLQLKDTAYSLSIVRDIINKKFESTDIGKLLLFILLLIQKQPGRRSTLTANRLITSIL